MGLTRTSAQALSSPMPFIVPLRTTCSRCLSPPYRISFRVRRRRSRCYAAADGRVGCAAPGHVTPGRVAAATVSVADATGLRRKNLATLRQRLLPAGSGGYSPDFPIRYRHDECWENAFRPAPHVCDTPKVRLSRSRTSCCSGETRGFPRETNMAAAPHNSLCMKEFPWESEGFPAEPC